MAVESMTQSMQLLVKKLEAFQFMEGFNVSNVMELMIGIESRYRNFSIFNQTNKILFLPYTIVFVVNKTVLPGSFIDLFEVLKKAVFGLSTKVEEHSPRVIINGTFIVLDMFPYNRLRYGFKLYTFNKDVLELNEEALDKLSYLQEVEVQIKNYQYEKNETGRFFKVSKKC